MNLYDILAAIGLHDATVVTEVETPIGTAYLALVNNVQIRQAPSDTTDDEFAGLVIHRHDTVEEAATCHEYTVRMLREDVAEYMNRQAGFMIV